jgi:hypothetical protein
MKKSKEDFVNHPKHYNQNNMQTIDYLQAYLSKEEFKGLLKANVIKYLSRSLVKGTEKLDYEKAQYYLNRLVELMNKGDSK